jgi:ABC-type multidrug transport system ATPase subunit
MIEAHGLTKRYGKRTAVDGITFTVQPGQVTGFLGPNGAGKSTTMRMILGLDRPTAGQVLVNGRPTPSTGRPCAKSAPCWMPKPSTRPAAPPSTCRSWPPHTASAAAGSRKSWQ